MSLLYLLWKYCQFRLMKMYVLGFHGGSDSKESACSGGDQGLILGSGTYPGEGSGYSLQYSCLENSMDKRSLVGYSLWGHKRFGQINVCSSDNYNILKSVLIVIVIYSRLLGWPKYLSFSIRCYECTFWPTQYIISQWN